MKRTSLALALISLGIAGGYALAEESDEFPERFQRCVERMVWFWIPEMTNVSYCIEHNLDGYEVELIYRGVELNSNRSPVKIRLIKNGKDAFSWEADPCEVFVQQRNRLVYSVFVPSTDGCRLVCVDLETGKELWKSDLQAIGFQIHSAYSNSILMQLGWKDLEGTVVVRGHESNGNYIEVVDLNTGKTLAHKRYDWLGGEVVAVIAGNQIRVRPHDGKEVEVSLDDIHCLEIEEPFGAAAKELTSKLVLGKWVTVYETGQDRSGQIYHEVFMYDDKLFKNENLSRVLVRLGAAWEDPAYPGKSGLWRLEREARDAKLGLWAEERSTPPWAWRHRNKHRN